MLDTWPEFAFPLDALELLDANFPDAHVRQFAVDTLARVSDDELGDFMIQLVQVSS